MHRNKEIQFLQRHQISDHTWNDCVAQSSETLVYAQTWYLDALCDDWGALVLNDYEAIMPLPLRKKWGIRYFYTPYFLPALKIITSNPRADHSPLFFGYLANNFSFGTLDIDQKAIEPVQDIWKIKERRNMIIPAGSTPPISRLAHRKLRASARAGVTVACNVPVQEIIYRYKEIYKETHASIPGSSYEQLVAACRAAPPENIITLAAHLPNQPFAGFYLLLSDKQNLYSLIGGSTPEGKKAGVFYTLTEKAVALAGKQKKNFRFEGSDVAGIAFFNSQFGPLSKPYLQLRLNQLLWPFNLLKK